MLEQGNFCCEFPVETGKQTSKRLHVNFTIMVVKFRLDLVVVATTREVTAIMVAHPNVKQDDVQNSPKILT